MKYIITSLLLTGCASYDLAVGSEFKPTNHGFEYNVASDLAYPLTSEKAEGQRINQLNKYITNNNICSRGYIVTKRTVVKVSKFNHRVYYDGSCNI